MIAIIFALVASIAAFTGGITAIKNRSKLNQTLGFTAGVILGLIAFDLLPEIFKITQKQTLDPVWPMIALVVGFLAFHITEKLILIHSSHESEYEVHSHPNVGIVGALALSGHSFLDGASIGVAFQVNNTVGLAVAIAVIGHRFADGFNTTNIMLSHKNKLGSTKIMLYIASLMPVVGALSTRLFSLSPKVLAVYLGFFAGFLLYIGASDILPQAHSKKSSKSTIILTILGVLLMFILTRLTQ